MRASVWAVLPTCPYAGDARTAPTQRPERQNARDTSVVARYVPGRGIRRSKLAGAPAPNCSFTRSRRVRTAEYLRLLFRDASLI